MLPLLITSPCRLVEAVQHLAQFAVYLRFFVVERERHAPHAVVERLVLRELVKQFAFKFLPYQRGIDRVVDDIAARGYYAVAVGDDGGGAGGVHYVVDVCQREFHVGLQVGASQRAQHLCVECHLSVLVGGNIVKETLGVQHHLIALADGTSPDAHLFFLGVLYLMSKPVDIPQRPYCHNHAYGEYGPFCVASECLAVFHRIVVRISVC